MELFKKEKAQKAPIRIAALCGLHHACHRAGRGNLHITVLQSLRKCLSLLASSPFWFRELREDGKAAPAFRTSHLGTQDSSGNTPSLCSIASVAVWWL